ncbi:MAG: hypothetical protein EPO06_03230 [Burkholderiaceae bacterium]|nr:MAG: hypothetical protein EPO06_03230 [Burkholderiaceae bacterium]
MKILVSYFFGKDQIPLGDSCLRALHDLGHDARGFHAATQHPWHPFCRQSSRILRGLGFSNLDLSSRFGISDTQYRSKRLLDEIELFRPDMLLVIRGYSYPRKFLQELQERYKIRLVGWCVKGPNDSGDILDDAAAYDIYFCSHTNIPATARKGEIQYLPVVGVDKLLYHPQPGEERSIPLTFVGGHNLRRGDLIGSIAKQIGHSSVTIYGPYWKRLSRRFNPRYWSSVKGPWIGGAELNTLYNRSKIVLNISSWDSTKLGALNMRVFDVPTAGAFLLTEFSPDLENYFQPGKEIEVWHSRTELLEKIDFYLRNDIARERIAQAGYEKALKLPTFSDKFQGLFGL